MTNDRSLAVVEADYRELSVVNGGNGSLNQAPFLPSDMWRPLPIPSDWTRIREKDDGTEEEVPYFVNRKALSKPTPKGQIKIHAKGYNYVTIDYIKKRLNEAFDYGRWTFAVTKREHGRTWTAIVGKDKTPKTYTEAMVGGWILAPGILPTYGEGSAPWAQDDQGDPRFSESTAWNSAESAALKSAAKKLGIGADIRENEDDQVLANLRITAASMFGVIDDEKKKADLVKKIVKAAPRSVIDGVFQPDRLTEDDAEDVVALLTLAVAS